MENQTDTIHWNEEDDMSQNNKNDKNISAYVIPLPPNIINTKLVVLGI